MRNSVIEKVLIGNAGEQWLSAEDFELLVKLKTRTVYKACREGRIPSVKIAGAVRIPASALKEFEARALASTRIDEAQK
jgi:excisionase family DNA binding protein